MGTLKGYNAYYKKIVGIANDTLRTGLGLFKLPGDRFSLKRLKRDENDEDEDEIEDGELSSSVSETVSNKIRPFDDRKEVMEYFLEGVLEFKNGDEYHSLKQFEADLTRFFSKFYRSHSVNREGFFLYVIFGSLSTLDYTELNLRNGLKIKISKIRFNFKDKRLSAIFTNTVGENQEEIFIHFSEIVNPKGQEVEKKENEKVIANIPLPTPDSESKLESEFSIKITLEDSSDYKEGDVVLLDAADKGSAKDVDDIDTDEQFVSKIKEMHKTDLVAETVEQYFKLVNNKYRLFFKKPKEEAEKKDGGLIEETKIKGGELIEAGRSEYVYHAFHCGVLMNFKNRYLIDIAVERVSGKGFVDFGFIVRGDEQGNINYDTAKPIVAELKSNLGTLTKAWQQIEARGYVNNYFSFRTLSENVICVAAQSSNEEAKEVSIIEPHNVVVKLLDNVDTDAGSVLTKKNRDSIIIELRCLYKHFLNGQNSKYENLYLLLLGSLLTIPEKIKIRGGIFKREKVFVYFDGSKRESMSFAVNFKKEKDNEQNKQNKESIESKRVIFSICKKDTGMASVGARQNSQKIDDQVKKVVVVPNDNESIDAFIEVVVDITDAEPAKSIENEEKINKINRDQPIKIWVAKVDVSSDIARTKKSSSFILIDKDCFITLESFVNAIKPNLKGELYTTGLKLKEKINNVLKLESVAGDKGQRKALSLLIEKEHSIQALLHGIFLGMNSGIDQDAKVRVFQELNVSSKGKADLVIGVIPSGYKKGTGKMYDFMAIIELKVSENGVPDHGNALINYMKQAEGYLNNLKCCTDLTSVFVTVGIYDKKEGTISFFTDDGGVAHSSHLSSHGGNLDDVSLPEKKTRPIKVVVSVDNGKFQRTSSNEEAYPFDIHEAIKKMEDNFKQLIGRSPLSCEELFEFDSNGKDQAEREDKDLDQIFQELDKMRLLKHRIISYNIEAKGVINYDFDKYIIKLLQKIDEVKPSYRLNYPNFFKICNAMLKGKSVEETKQQSFTWLDSEFIKNSLKSMFIGREVPNVVSAQNRDNNKDPELLLTLLYNKKVLSKFMPTFIHAEIWNNFYGKSSSWSRVESFIVDSINLEDKVWEDCTGLLNSKFVMFQDMISENSLKEIKELRETKNVDKAFYNLLTQIETYVPDCDMTDFEFRLRRALAIRILFKIEGIDVFWRYCQELLLIFAKYEIDALGAAYDALIDGLDKRIKDIKGLNAFFIVLEVYTYALQGAIIRKSDSDLKRRICREEYLSEAIEASYEGKSYAEKRNFYDSLYKDLMKSGAFDEDSKKRMAFKIWALARRFDMDLKKLIGKKVADVTNDSGALVSLLNSKHTEMKAFLLEQITKNPMPDEVRSWWSKQILIEAADFLEVFKVIIKVRSNYIVSYNVPNNHEMNNQVEKTVIITIKGYKIMNPNANFLLGAWFKTYITKTSKRGNPLHEAEQTENVSLIKDFISKNIKLVSPDIMGISWLQYECEAYCSVLGEEDKNKIEDLLVRILLSESKDSEAMVGADNYYDQYYRRLLLRVYSIGDVLYLLGSFKHYRDQVLELLRTRNPSDSSYYKYYKPIVDFFKKKEDSFKDKDGRLDDKLLDDAMKEISSAVSRSISSAVSRSISSKEALNQESRGIANGQKRAKSPDDVESESSAPNNKKSRISSGNNDHVLSLSQEGNINIGNVKERSAQHPSVESCSSSSRKKRAIRCNEQRADVLPYDPLQDIDAGVVGARSARLYHYVLMAQAWEHPEFFHLDRSEAIDQLVTYSRYIGEIINEGKSNRSPREEKLLRDHYAKAEGFKTVSTENGRKVLQKLNDPEVEIADLMAQRPDAHRSWIFDNGHYSVMVLFDGSHYQLYSPDFNYQQLFKTEKARSFEQVTGLVRVFFKWRSGSEQYTCLGLSNDLPESLSPHLKEASCWKSSDTFAPDRVLLDSSGLIAGIPVEAVLELFYINGRTPGYAELHQDFFKDAHGVTLRVEQLHTVLATLRKEERVSLIEMIRRKKIPADDDLYNLLDKDKQKLFKDYQNHVMGLLESDQVDNLDHITPELLSNIFRGVLSNEFDRLNVPPDLRDKAIDNMHAMGSHAADRYAKLKGVATDAVFFLPDIIRAWNTKDFSGLATTGAMIAADTVLNNIIEHCASSLGEFRVSLLQRLPITSPVFKILTVYSIVTLYKELNTLPVDSPRRQTIIHQLEGQYATVGLMVFESLAIMAGFTIELGPLWLGLMAWQTVMSGQDFLREHQLDLSLAEGIWMSLGGDQDTLTAIFEERHLVDISLYALENFSNGTNGWNFVKVPKLSQPVDWQPVNETQLSREIQQYVLSQKPLSNNKTEYFGQEYSCDRLTPRRTCFNSFKVIETDVFKVDGCGFELTNTTEYRIDGVIVAPSRSSIAHSKQWKRGNCYVIPSEVYVSFYPDGLNYQEDNIFLVHPEGERDYYKRIVSVMSKPSNIFKKLVLGISRIINTTAVLFGEKPGILLPTPVQIVGPGLSALYVNNKTFVDPIKQRNLYTVFDSREGNMTFLFWEVGLKELDKLNLSHNSSYPINSSESYVLTVYVGHKMYYPESIVFIPTERKTIDSINGLFELITDSQRVISKYVITSDNHNQFDIVDRSLFTHIYFNSSPSMGFLINSSIDSRTIIMECKPINESALGSSSIQLNENKKYLRLMMQHQVIDDVLHLSADSVQVQYVEGKSSSSTLNMASDVVTFEVVVLGNLVVNYGNTSLYFIGEKSVHTTPIIYKKNHLLGIDDLWTLQISDLELVFDTLIRANESHISFSCEALNCLWKQQHEASYYTIPLQIIGRFKNQTAILELAQNTTTLTVLGEDKLTHHRSVSHHTKSARVANNLVLRKIINVSDGNNASTSTMGMDVISSKLLSKMINKDGSGVILVLQSPQANFEVHHFSDGDNITLNDIDYRVQQNVLYVIGAKDSVITRECLIGSQNSNRALGLLTPLNKTKLFSEVDGSISVNDLILRGFANRDLIYFGSNGYTFQTLKDSISRNLTALWELLEEFSNHWNTLNVISDEMAPPTTAPSTTAPSTTMLYNGTHGDGILESNHSMSSRRPIRVDYLTADELAVIDKEFRKLDPMIIDGLKYVMITILDLAAKDVDIHKCLGFRLLEDQEKFKEEVRAKNINTMFFVHKILPCPELVQATVWLIVKRYSDLWLGSNILENGALLTGVIQCFEEVVNPRLIRRIIRNIETKSGEGILFKVERFIEHHQRDLQSSIQSSILLKLDLTIKKGEIGSVLNCTDPVYSHNATDGHVLSINDRAQNMSTISGNYSENWTNGTEANHYRRSRRSINMEGIVDGVLTSDPIHRRNATDGHVLSINDRAQNVSIISGNDSGGLINGIEENNYQRGRVGVEDMVEDVIPPDRSITLLNDKVGKISNITTQNQDVFVAIPDDRYRDEAMHPYKDAVDRQDLDYSSQEQVKLSGYNTIDDIVIENNAMVNQEDAYASAIDWGWKDKLEGKDSISSSVSSSASRVESGLTRWCKSVGSAMRASVEVPFTKFSEILSDYFIRDGVTIGGSTSGLLNDQLRDESTQEKSERSNYTKTSALEAEIEGNTVINKLVNCDNLLFYTYAFCLLKKKKLNIVKTKHKESIIADEARIVAATKGLSPEFFKGIKDATPVGQPHGLDVNGPEIYENSDNVLQDIPYLFSNLAHVISGFVDEECTVGYRERGHYVTDASPYPILLDPTIPPQQPYGSY